MNRTCISPKGRDIVISCGAKEIICSYEKEILARNQIDGMCEITFEYIDDLVECHYMVDGCVSLEEYYRDHKMNMEEFQLIMKGVRNIMEQISRFLLSEEGIALSPDLIFFRNNKSEVVFCYQLGIRLDVETQFQMLMDWIIGKIDSTDKNLVLAAYGIQTDSGGDVSSTYWKETDADQFVDYNKYAEDISFNRVEETMPKTSGISSILTKLRRWFTLEI